MHDEPMDVGTWAQDKLECLKKYLNPYSKILNKQSWCTNYWYVDAFAGPGKLRLRNEPNHVDDAVDILTGLSPFFDGGDDEGIQQLISGSPKIALDTEPPFTNYLFIENDKHHVRALERLKDVYKGREFEIQIEQGDCNEILRQWLTSNNWTTSRGIVFLDPFGTQVPWETIKNIARPKTLEIIMNFPLGMAIHRLLPRNGNFTTKQMEKLNNYFGTDEWHDILYKAEENLFGEAEQKITQSSEILLGWYLDRLKSIFQFVSPPFLVRNTRNAPLYYLIFAGHNKTGCKIASDIFSQGNNQSESLEKFLVQNNKH